MATASAEISTVAQSVASLERQGEARYSQLQALVRSQADDITGLHSKIDSMVGMLSSMQADQAAGTASAVTLRLP